MLVKGLLVVRGLTTQWVDAQSLVLLANGLLWYMAMVNISITIIPALFVFALRSSSCQWRTSIYLLAHNNAANITRGCKSYHCRWSIAPQWKTKWASFKRLSRIGIGWNKVLLLVRQQAFTWFNAEIYFAVDPSEQASVHLNLNRIFPLIKYIIKGLLLIIYHISRPECNQTIL